MSCSVDGLHLLADEEGFSSKWIYQEITVCSAFSKQKIKNLKVSCIFTMKEKIMSIEDYVLISCFLRNKPLAAHGFKNMYTLHNPARYVDPYQHTSTLCRQC